MRPVIHKVFSFFLLGSIVAGSVFPAQAKDSARNIRAKEPTKPASSRTKVSTNESPESARRNWNRYLDDNAAAQGISHAASPASSSNMNAGQLQAPAEIPKTLEDTDQQIAATTKKD